MTTHGADGIKRPSPDRKTLEQLIAEYREYEHMLNKTYEHKKSGQLFQAMALAHTEAENDLVMVYCLCAMSKLKFTRPVREFVDRFTEKHWPKTGGE